jgi:hypothetical protein
VRTGSQGGRRARTHGRNRRAVGMVATDRDLALMIEQRIEHMQRLACRCRDQLGEERPVAVGEMGVDLEPRLLAVMSIETAGGTAEPTGLEELPVGRRSSTAPEYRRKRLTLLLIDPRASIAVSRSSRSARRLSMKRSKSASTTTGSVSVLCRSCRVSSGVRRKKVPRWEPQSVSSLDRSQYPSSSGSR